MINKVSLNDQPRLQLIVNAELSPFGLFLAANSFAPLLQCELTDKLDDSESATWTNAGTNERTTDLRQIWQLLVKYVEGTASKAGKQSPADDASAHNSDLTADRTQIEDEWLNLALNDLKTKEYSGLQPIFAHLQRHLLINAFINGPAIGPVDFLVFGALFMNPLAPRAIKGSSVFESVSRWYQFIFEDPKHTELIKKWQTERSKHKRAAKQTASLPADKKDNAINSRTSKANFEIGLKDAEVGKVVTRFPPEPSGYLHIGHAKAALLNQYFAKHYKGRLILRFDDTNPTKENSEFEDSIKEDLALIEVGADALTYTSDYFKRIFDLAVQMIKDCKAYADDTLQEDMRQERMDGIASRRRNQSVEENLRIFTEEMAHGTEEGCRWCLRAKISVDNLNKALRDPVIYRCNLTPHHRTGDRWKVYPTYDFCCPIVDSVEGVTHALRTIEYRDRDPQYSWMLKALGLRKVHVWEFSRLNFIKTVLSKRKLQKLVDSKVVSGWDDPRMPTIQGIRRRGMTVEALRQFIISQGPSKNSINLDWTSVWAVNKRIIDPVAPRHTAIDGKNIVNANVEGITQIEKKLRLKHKKNPGVGEKTVTYGPSILIAQEDAQTFGEDEEITLMDWGNAFVREIVRNDDGIVIKLRLDLFLEGDFKKTDKKITWLADTDEKTPIEIHVFDHLITKEKLDPEDNFEDFVNIHTDSIYHAFADANAREISKGTIVQFERKGYFVCDEPFDGKRAVFFDVPDGKVINRYGAKSGPVKSLSKADVPQAIENRNGSMKLRRNGLLLRQPRALVTAVLEDLAIIQGWNQLNSKTSDLFGAVITGLNPLSGRIEGVYPIALSESVSPQIFDSLFKEMDNLGILTTESRGVVSEYQDENLKSKSDNLSIVKTLLFGIVARDSTIMYYRFSNGLMKPRQHGEA